MHARPSRGDVACELSRDSLAIERSLVELYEPNRQAPTMLAIDVLRDLAKRSVTMPTIVSDALSTRKRLTPGLNQDMKAAFERVARAHPETYADVRMDDDGHGTWKVSGLQRRPNADLNSTVQHGVAGGDTPCPVGNSFASTGEQPPSSSSNRGDHRSKQARLAEPGILQPATKFKWQGQDCEIVSHDTIQSTQRRHLYYLKQNGECLATSYQRDSTWIVAEQSTGQMEQDLLGVESTVLDWKTIRSWDDEKVRR